MWEWRARMHLHLVAIGNLTPHPESAHFDGISLYWVQSGSLLLTPRVVRIGHRRIHSPIRHEYIMNSSIHSVSVEKVGPRVVRVVYHKSVPAVLDNCKRFPTFHPSAECSYPGYCIEVRNVKELEKYWAVLRY